MVFDAIGNPSTFIDMYWNWKIPVDIEGISNNLGLSVVFDNELDSELEAKLNIANSKSGFNRYDLHLRPSISDEQKRYMIAHVIAYISMHHHCIHEGDANFFTIEDFSLESTSWSIKRCQQLALEYIIPKEAVDYLILKERITDLSVLANKLGVSENAVYERLTQLKWLTMSAA
ncbi:ImmA/IrrE family metallo-endopeptidase [Vibrio parahaemolyticus]|nr:ImmA/IrrE family metallo-endopeptidase [Vibrio parahaemolyticus]EGR5926594.1 ImmA/IrrE family metallo-endopeptidase [Vibrio parahaemolyticus]EJG0181300.1 ImmA/IrrE family metallo-endopeptidase [Vibrio parahaemolyticus]KOY41161.1 hypothetical protein ACX10_02315 [Vibrio parahaemolyticus]MCS0117210.1 ImmA/IrrE family metallo-endopeptidase [Vibrio parahaemolyticus]